MVEIVECVPNFSEGRRPDVIQALVEACVGPGVILLDHHADADHNRLVVTFIGDRSAVRAAALRAARQAAALIDMAQHQGSHPRMGALDVLPLVPIQGVTMADCVALAEEVGAALGELGIAVYLYEEAARNPARRNLADVRRGEYEGLRADVAAGARLPDYGPAALNSAGATAVGARPPLVAFNVNLGCADVKVAKSIANRVREARGGLKNVKAIGLELTGRPVVQVSMNLVDTTATPIYRVLELVRIEAARYGVPIMNTEVVGLVPQAALVDSAVYYLQAEGFKATEQVLENRVTEALLAGGSGVLSPPTITGSGGDAPVPGPGFGAMPLGEFARALAAGTPAPGGGTAAAVAGALGAGLVAMVARLSQGRRFAEVAAEMASIARAADAVRVRLLELADADTTAFNTVMAAYRLPKGTSEEQAQRQVAIGKALEEAARVPLAVAQSAQSMLDPAATVARQGNPNSASDIAVAVYVIRSAVEGALLNVETNLKSLAEIAAQGGPPLPPDLPREVDQIRSATELAALAALGVAEARARGTG